MSYLPAPPKYSATFVDADGYTVPAVGWKLYAYAAGTSNLKDTYTSSTLGTANANPVVLDTRGEADIWLSGNYKFILKTDADATIWTVDNINDLTSSGTFTNATLAGTLTITSTALTWSGNPTHSGNHTWSGNQVFNGNVTLGDAAADALTVNPNAVTWAGNPTHSGDHTWSGSQTYTTPSVGMSVCKIKTANTSRASTVTVIDDTHLVQALGVGTWKVSVFVPVWGTTTADGGMKSGLYFSGTSTNGIQYHEARTGGSVTATSGIDTSFVDFAAATIAVGTSSISESLLRIEGFLIVTVAGNLSWKWAQNVSDTDATNAGIGGNMICTRLA